MIYWKYLKYVLRHKWYVMLACFKIGLYWRGIMHDMSKFLPSEFIPYARFFYGKYPSLMDIHGDERNAYSGKFKETVKADFNLAWLKHQKRNPHHWQYWLLQNDTDGMVPLAMQETYILEMICDWIGAGKAINGKNDLFEWYQKNRSKMILETDTRSFVEWHIAGMEAFAK